jgi:F0F1-type ATP synthase assembly protein I
MAMMMSSEVAAGAAIGWIIDRLAGTRFWLLAGGLTGLAVGLTSFVTAALKLGRSAAPPAPGSGDSRLDHKRPRPRPEQGDGDHDLGHPD